MFSTILQTSIHVYYFIYKSNNFFLIVITASLSFGKAWDAGCFYTSPFNAVDKYCRAENLGDFGGHISFAINFSPNASCSGSTGTPPVCAVAVWK
jgi:hypothetical protein